MGWVLHRHRQYSCALVVVFQIHVEEFAFGGVNAESQTPVAG
jgi:hypothetical protein